MAKARFIQLACMGLGLFSFACAFENPCQANDPELVKKFGIPKQQTEGADGMCYAVDPAVPNWGGACDSLSLCGGGLICLAPDLPICTAIDCNTDPTKDKVCGEGFTCIATGDTTPNICIPIPAPMPSSTATSSSPTSDLAGDAGADGGADTNSTEPEEAAPNVGATCSMQNDPICVGGTFCEPVQLKICTLANCAPGLENEAACAAVGFCYSTPPAPESGICTVQ